MLADAPRKQGWQFWLDIYLFVNFLGYCVWRAWQAWAAGQLGYVEVAFTALNIVLAFVILLRKPHREVDARLLHQAIALTAFLSGAAFMGQPGTSTPLLLDVSRVVTAAANILGLVTLLNIGRSFGILVAFREVRTGGLYSVVRHPMYGTDILLRIGFLISHFTVMTAAVFVLSSGCYVYRALLEERFLARWAEYRTYMDQVRWRFIPGVF